MYVEKSGRIFVETFHPDYEKLRHFLISCCEPVCRTSHVNEYQILPTSLQAAASEGVFSRKDIEECLKQYGRGDGEEEEESHGSDERHRGAVGGGVTNTGYTLSSEIRDMLDRSDSEKSLRIELGRDARNHEQLTSELRYYLVSNSKRDLERLVQGNHHIQDYLEPVNAAATSSKGSGGGEGEGSSSTFIFSDQEVYEVSLVGGEELMKKQQQRQSMRQRIATAGGSGSGKEGGGVNDYHLSGGNDSSSGPPQSGTSKMMSKRLVFKCQLRKNCLTKLRDVIQNEEGVHIDVSYDYATDNLTPSVPNFRLKATTKLRPYQEQSLERFQSRGKVRNGVVVLPCGAGKSLTGIAAASILAKPCVVACINAQSVLQWRDQFLRWTTLNPAQVSICTSEEKPVYCDEEKGGEIVVTLGDIFITTYQMLTAPVESNATKSRHRGAERSEISQRNFEMKKRLFEEIHRRSWGLLVLDEVHQGVAETFSNVIADIKHHCVLGLTATLLREDDKIRNLLYLIGPKLFEANWLELAKAGFLATVHCAEIGCRLPIPLLRLYTTVERREQKHIECMNPKKLWACQALIEFHTKTRSPSDKVIVFCDSRHGIKYFAHKLGVPFMDGDASPEERNGLLENFRKNPLVNVVLISKVGDTALDLPEANVIIQINGQDGSRRQEAQRLGRILRPKPPSSESSSAFFYTLVSSDTREEDHTFKRQQWLREQGFAYRVLDEREVLSSFLELQPTPSLLCVGPPQWSFRLDVGGATEGEESWYEECETLMRDFGILKDGVEFPDESLQAIMYADDESRSKHRQQQKSSAWGGSSCGSSGNNLWMNFPQKDAKVIEKAYLHGRSKTLLHPAATLMMMNSDDDDGSKSTRFEVVFQPANPGTGLLIRTEMTVTETGETVANAPPTKTLIRRGHGNLKKFSGGDDGDGGGGGPVMKLVKATHECGESCFDFVAQALTSQVLQQQQEHQKGGGNKRIGGGNIISGGKRTSRKVSGEEAAAFASSSFGGGVSRPEAKRNRSDV